LTHLTCGLVRFDHVAGQQLIALLPKILQIDTREEEEGSWLQSTLRFIAREARELRPGGETVITHLADILIIQAIRSWLDSAPDANRGWLAALRDRQIGRALAAIHREPQKAWSVASLAREVGMSRSGFSARFSQLVGDSAMRYLTRWRMQLARAQLGEESVPLGVLAERLGYQSEAAFCRAFKREFGVSPGSLRQAQPQRAIVPILP
jgi:AraC-like DNA-binding protein